MANDVPGDFCRVGVKQPAAPQKNRKAQVKSLLIENQPSRKTALHGHSAKSPKDVDTSRWLTLANTMVVFFVSCEAS
jgi:hypothetical protein